MKKLLTTLFLLMPFCACYSGQMDEYWENCEKKIHEDSERQARYLDRQQEEATNRAIQRELSPLNNINKKTKACPG